MERVYEDDTTAVDTTFVTLKRYYFPFARPKRIKLADIESITIRRSSWMTRYRLWGSNNFRNWLPLDLHRPGKTHMIELDIGKWVRPMFTPDDPQLVADLLRRDTPNPLPPP